MNAAECLENVNSLIDELNGAKKEGSYDFERFSWIGKTRCFNIESIYDECGIFDWWRDTISSSQLKQMQSFLKTAIKMGYTGYVCFKVGAAGCSHGMWAYKNESTKGCSPDGACLHHSFVPGKDYYDVRFEDGTWLGNEEKWKFTLKEIKDALAERS